MCLLYNKWTTNLTRVYPLTCLLLEDLALAALAVENGVHVEHLGVIELKVGEERC